jgi:hypothetical protein
MPLRTALVALAGLLLPVGLGLAMYFSSAGAIGASPPALPASLTVGRPAATTTAPAKERTKKRDRPAATTAVDDHGDRCSEPEHVNDPECVPGDDDNSGSGSNTGPGSDSSGPGSGDD